MLARDIKINSAPIAPPFNGFMKWLRDYGCRFPTANLTMNGNQRTVVTTQPVKPGDTIIFIPNYCLMTDGVAHNSAIGQQIFRTHFTPTSKHTVLAAYLLQERENPVSLWRHYIDLLPRSFAHIPLYFDNATLNYLQGSYILELVLSRKHIIKSEYYNLCNALPSFRRFSLDDFMWARTAINSRCFGISHIHGASVAMVPFIDLVNHHQSGPAYWGAHPSQHGFSLTANDYIFPNMELFMSYGTKTKGRFFASYGFIPENSDNKDARVTASLNIKDELYDFKRKFVNASLDFMVSFQYDDAFKSLFKYLRIASISQFDSNLQLDKAVHTQFISLENELKSLRHLHKLCQQSLNLFETSLREDIQLLSTPDFYDTNTNNAINSILIRSMEKRVLHNIMDFSKHALRILQSFQTSGIPSSIDIHDNKMLSEYLKDMLFYCSRTSNSHCID